jgi:hypothetical protein
MFTEEELTEMKAVMDSLGNYLPDSQMSNVWNWYKRITNSKEPQPCSCKSSSGLWVKAVTAVRHYITELNNGNE